MTEIYFVRHAQSDTSWHGLDKDKPLTECGLKDSGIITIALRDIKFDYCICSSYKRSISTISECAKYHGLIINTDNRFGERKSGINSTENDLKKRWQNFDYKEFGGESIGECQKRNIEALMEVLDKHQDETILLGTHGTALSAILNYFYKSIDINYFYQVFDWLPYVCHATFDKDKLIKYENVVILNRGY